VGDHDALMGEIGALLASSSRDLDLLERTLTDGYATALSLEGEHWRLRRQLGVIVSSLEDGDVESKSRELSDLARRIELSEGTLARLREILARLRGEYSEAAEAAALKPAARR
jgi:hypothetical protein